MSDVLAAVVVEALLVGGRLALFAAGFTILFGGLRMPFVAYGQVILLGAYGIWTANAVLQQNYFLAATVGFVRADPASSTVGAAVSSAVPASLSGHRLY